MKKLLICICLLVSTLTLATQGKYMMLMKQEGFQGVDYILSKCKVKQQDQVSGCTPIKPLVSINTAELTERIDDAIEIFEEENEDERLAALEAIRNTRARYRVFLASSFLFLLTPAPHFFAIGALTAGKASFCEIKTYPVYNDKNIKYFYSSGGQNLEHIYIGQYVEGTSAVLPMTISGDAFYGDAISERKLIDTVKELVIQTPEDLVLSLNIAYSTNCTGAALWY